MSGRELDPDGTDSYHPDHPWEQTAHPLYVPPSARTTGNWPPVDADPAGPHEAARWAALPPGPRGRVEPTVQVPVSLIEDARDAIDTQDWEHANTRAALDALLSQSTPTADEPGLTPSELRAWRALDQQKADAGPPRIEDMAPGTTFRADTIATRYGSRWTVLPSGRVESGMGIGHEASEIDPSTIRDVTPPAGT